MQELLKIRDVSVNYGVSTRSLRYYEEAGLISSTRNDDYSYRMYDNTAIKRLEQILILRKLNISIKDIQKIFSSQGSEIVLDVLGKKVDDIDGEVALLYELKEIIFGFIRQIESLDFNNESDVKLLYEKAKEIEERISDNETGSKTSKSLYILPKFQWCTGVILTVDLGDTKFGDYNRFSYRVKPNENVYGKGMSAYVSDSVDALHMWALGNESGLALFHHNHLVPDDDRASGTNWLDGVLIPTKNEVKT